MRKFLLTVLAVALLSSLASAKKPLKPNIIYIMADDLGSGDVGFNGQQYILTPNIDRMAKDGMIFNNHYTGSTVCGPSRAVLMTGKHTGHASVRENPKWTNSGLPADLKPEDVTVAEELKRAGYTTGIIGKWGLAENLTDGMPNRQGFDYFYGFNKHGAAHHYYPEQLWENETQFTVKGNVTAEKKGQYSHYLFTEKAINFMEKNKEEPFFLYLAYTIPHYELTVPAIEKELYKDVNWKKRKMKSGHYLNDEEGNITYASMVSLMDKDIGHILDLLKEWGIDENTLVIFTSDNGHEYDKLNDEFFNSNGDYSGRKRDLTEGGIHAPFVAQWTGTVAPGSRTNHVSAFWDFLPTMCELAGVKPSDDIDGISYVPTLLGKDKKQKEHDYLYWEFNERQGPTQALLQDDWKLLRRYNKPTALFYLPNDQGEINNLAEVNPEKFQELELLMDNARTEHPEFPLVLKKKKQ